MSVKKWWKAQRRRFRERLATWRHAQATAQYKRRQQKEDRDRRSSRQPSALKVAWQKYQIQRRLRQERRKAWLAKFQRREGVVGFLRRRQGLVVWLLTLGLATTFVVVALRGQGLDKPAGVTQNSAEAVVVVNGKAISRNHFVAALELTYGPVILQRLTEQEAVRQEADRLKLSLTLDETDRLAAIVKDDPRHFVRENELRTQMLLRKLALRDITEQRRREVYEQFTDDLRVYHLVGYRFKDKSAAEQFAAMVKSGAATKKASEKYALDGDKVVNLGAITVAQIQERFGKAAAFAVDGGAPGSFTQPLSVQPGYVIYQVVQVDSSFEKVQEAIDTLIADAEQTQVLYRVLSKAKIESPYLEKNLLVPTPTPTP